MTLALAAASYSSDDAHWCGRIPTTWIQKGGFNDASQNILYSKSSQSSFLIRVTVCPVKEKRPSGDWTEPNSRVRTARGRIFLFCCVLAHVTKKVKTSVGPWYLWSATPCMFPGCCSFSHAVCTSVFAVLSDYLNFTAFNGSSEIKVRSSGRWGNKLHLSY